MNPTESFNLFELEQGLDKEIQLSYSGPFHSKVLTVVGDYISRIIGRKSVIGQKLFKVFIELAQNISFYSDEKTTTAPIVGIGTILIRDTKEELFLHTGNIILNENAEKLINNCNHINSLNRLELREFKRDQRNMKTGRTGTANIGLIQVALTSDNPLEFEITTVDKEYKFFSIMVTLNKKKNNKLRAPL